MLATAIIMGLVGSLHCVGMCGPIVLALPFNRFSGASKVMAITTYNLGRISTYFLLGLISGVIGKSAAYVGFQQWLSIAIGVIILAWFIFPSFFKKRFSFSLAKILGTNSLMGRLIKQKSVSMLFVVGLLNGLLPCGLVFVAMGGAAAQVDILQGGIFMALFGLGTFPALVAVPMVFERLKGGFRKQLVKIVPVYAILFGLFLILRGSNLGIPYLSPKFEEETQEMSCCHKSSQGESHCGPSN